MKVWFICYWFKILTVRSKKINILEYHDHHRPMPRIVFYVDSLMSRRMNLLGIAAGRSYFMSLYSYCRIPDPSSFLPFRLFERLLFLRDFRAGFLGTGLYPYYLEEYSILRPGSCCEGVLDVFGYSSNKGISLILVIFLAYI